VGAVAGFVEGRTLGVASAGLGVETAPAAAERRTAVPAGLVEGATGEPVAEQRDSAMTTSRVAAPGEVGSSSRCIARTTMPDPPGASSGSCSLSTIWAIAGTSTTVLGGAGVTGTAVPPSLSAPRCTDPELATGFASQVLERSAATRMPATERPCTSARLLACGASAAIVPPASASSRAASSTPDTPVTPVVTWSGPKWVPGSVTDPEAPPGIGACRVPNRLEVTETPKALPVAPAGSVAALARGPHSRAAAARIAKNPPVRKRMLP